MIWWLYGYLGFGLTFVGIDVWKEWDREQHGYLLPVLVLIVCGAFWPLYLAWKFHYLESGE